MTTTTPTAYALPKVVSRVDWLSARRALLAEEKSIKRQLDAVAARRRRLPMVRLEKPYHFTGPEGQLTLLDLFEGRRQLYVHHFMWNEQSRTFCPGCTAAANTGFNNPHVRAYLNDRDVTFVAISRAPLEEIEAYRAEQGWTFPWYSSGDSDFNYDFHTTLDETRAPIEYNYRNREELLETGLAPESLTGDWPANSVFVTDGASVYHTYSAYTRGLDQLFLPFHFLELTPYGRQEDWEDSPEGWPQRPTHG